jgi:excisionase family DNA binding protein
MPIDSHRDRPLISVEEAAGELGLSRSALYRSIHKGDLPIPLVKISGRWRIPRRALQRLIDGESPLVPAVSAGGAAGDEVEG